MVSKCAQTKVAEATTELTLCDCATTKRIKVLEIFTHSAPVGQRVVAYPGHEVTDVDAAQVDRLFGLDYWGLNHLFLLVLCVVYKFYNSRNKRLQSMVSSIMSEKRYSIYITLTITLR